MSQYVYFKDIYFGKNSLVKVFPEKDGLETATDINAITTTEITNITTIGKTFNRSTNACPVAVIP